LKPEATSAEPFRLKPEATSAEPFRLKPEATTEGWLKAEATNERGFRLQAEGFPDLAQHALERLHWVERRTYSLDCNWKVFVDNYLDGGYHVPHLHAALDAALDYGKYRIDLGERWCLQSSPTSDGGGAYYYWVYPHIMVNIYADRMDTNVVIPRGVDRTDVVFDFYFADPASPAIRDSIAASERIQDEDVGVCVSVQRGLRSRAYDSGRLSVRREAGEHLFHRLLAADLRAALDRP
jgi:choline monooxygenase